MLSATAMTVMVAALAPAGIGNVCVPFAIVVVFHITLYGTPVSSAPRLAPSSLNCTPATPTLSVALAETVTDEPDTVALFAGALKETAGGVESVLPYR